MPDLKRFFLILSLLLGTLIMACTEGNEPENPPAPDFPLGLDWFNVPKPLRLADLRGKVVLLDFWTYGCINCIHVMEELKRLEQRFGPALVVIGVHSPKFENEANPDTLRSILTRYQRNEPVVNDPDYRMMRRYGARAWPTLVLIDPLGGYVGWVSGEGHEEALAQAIQALLDRYADQLDPKPLALKLPPIPDSGWFGAPEKIAVNEQFVAISDSLFHRVLIADHQGKLRYSIGGKTAGFRDGTFSEARFRNPRGLIFASESVLWVADTGNHAIRRIDLQSEQVQTVAGTGRRGLHGSVSGKPPRAIDLRSPWALALNGDQLFIAMAGAHQIWRLDLRENRLVPYAGSGREGIQDGPLKRASFSQPSGLALRDHQLYVADAEASALRVIDLREERVHTLVGTGLFDFGDRDGPLAQAQLQHAQGIAPLEAGLAIADTYNHKIKRLDLRTERLETLVGNGYPGDQLNPKGASLDEPGGIARFGDRLFIADTNNRRILVWHQKAKQLTPWTLKAQD